MKGNREGVWKGWESFRGQSKSGPVKGRGENVGWKHPRPLFSLREGWQSCWEVLEPKLANKGVPES